jgi:hypothetical protein
MDRAGSEGARLTPRRDVRSGPAGGERRIHAFDRHRIDVEAWRTYVGDRLPYPPDGDFLPVEPELLGPRHSVVAFHSGDFPAIAPLDTAIEILSIDIAKALATSDHVVCAYFTKRITGRSIVIPQE